MTPKKVLRMIIVAGALSASHASAQTTTVRAATLSDPALEKLVAEALARNPDVAASEAAAEAARFRIAAARALPDPALSLAYQNDGTALSLGKRDMTFLGLAFSQALPWPGKLQLAGEIARAEGDRAAAGALGRTRLAVEARVRRSYYEYLLARGLLDLIEDRSRAWREISGIVRERYAVGLGVQQDVLRAEVEVLRLDEARADRAAEVANRRAELDRLLGRPQDTPIGTAQHLDFRPALAELSVILRAVFDRSAELAAIERAVEAARLRVSLSRKDFFPDFVASGGPMYRGGLDPMWQVGLGITVPIYAGSRQRPRLQAAQADLRAQEARAASTRLELEFRTRERFESLTATLKVARLYGEGVLPVDQLSLESALASYRTGKVPFVTVLEALNSLYSDRALYLRRLAEAEKWRVAIDEADLAARAGMGDAAMATASPAPVVPASSGGAMTTMR